MNEKSLYWIWGAMVQRCTNPKSRQFRDYGGRGITVCAEWRTFEAFARDMGERPSADHSLDRIDNNAGYSPSNCRWSTRKENNSNRRNCIYVMDGEERVTLREYCRRHGLCYRPIVKRIQDRNWPVDLALRIPVGSRSRFRFRSERAA